MISSRDVASASTESKLTFDPVQSHLRDDATDVRENEDRTFVSPELIKENLKSRGFPMDWVEKFVKVNFGEGESYDFESLKKVHRLEHRNHLDRLGFLKNEEDLNVGAYLVLLGATALDEKTVVETAKKLDELIQNEGSTEETKRLAKLVQEGQFITWLPFAKSESQAKQFIFGLNPFAVIASPWKKRVLEDYVQFLDNSQRARVNGQSTSGPALGETE
ncbi:hypothetical protein PsorP6_016524 [Peronosclerospora sorghi]|uniref:Uncharacterized protein n=1 Tax=Peronosclerospora sorghi TaxID=230839 RepID=A0ACC0VIM5_9STRA|nr:hypothetical protein PsorP6_016524 [Peronosclerospora sorghi]